MSRWVAYVRIRLLARLAHRGDWVAGLVADVVVAGVGLAIILALYVHVPTVRGFSREEILVCWGFAEAARGVVWMLGRGLFVAHTTYVLDGALDRVLLRPLHPVGQILADHVHLGAWPGVVWGLAVVVTAAGGVDVLGALTIVAGVAGGTAILGGVLAALSSVGLWAHHRGSAVNLAWQATSFAAYPPSFLPWPLALGLTTVLPFTFVGFAPGCWLLDRPVPAWVWAQPAVALAALFVGGAAWRLGLARYGSTGS